MLVLVCHSTNCSASSPDLALADSLLRLGYLNEASLKYEEVLYGNPDNTLLKCEVLLHKTQCLKEQGLFDRIVPLLRRIPIDELPDSLKFAVYYEKSISSFLTEQFEQAEQYILPVFNLEINSVQYHAACILQSLVLNEQGRWMEAASLLNNVINTDTMLSANEKSDAVTMINELYNPSKIPVIRSIKKARTLSLLFPGLGQFYNGNTGTGLLSLGFVSLSGLYIAYNIINTTYLTAATSGVYLFLYFYFGGANQSSVLVPKKNTEKKSAYNNYLRKGLLTLNSNYFQL